MSERFIEVPITDTEHCTSHCGCEGECEPDKCDEVRRLKARIKELTEWRPMDTAPKDGTFILALFEGMQFYVMCSFRHGGWFLLQSVTSFSNKELLKWLPLPEVK